MLCCVLDNWTDWLLKIDTKKIDKVTKFILYLFIFMPTNSYYKNLYNNKHSNKQPITDSHL